MSTKDTTIRTTTPDIELRNKKNRIAVLTMRRVMGQLTQQEREELATLQKETHVFVKAQS